MILNTIPATPDDGWKAWWEGEEEEACSPSESYITTCCCLCLYYSGKMLIIYAGVVVKIHLRDSAVLTQDLSFTNSLPSHPLYLSLHPSLSLPHPPSLSFTVPLTDTKRRYDQIEPEILTVMWCLGKSNQWTHSWKMNFVSDHKPFQGKEVMANATMDVYKA